MKAEIGLLRLRRHAPVFAALGVLAFGLTVYLSLPGYMSQDSGEQLAQARSLLLRDDHPILMALIWRYTDRVLAGPTGMLVLTSFLYWAGLAALFWALPGSVVMRVLGAVVVGFFPPVFTIIPVVWKDTLMQGALVAALACLAFAAQRRRARWLLLAGALFLVAIGARHNAIAAAWPLPVLFILCLPIWLGRARYKRLLLSCGIALGATVLVAVGLSRALSPLSKKTHYWQTVPIFDLAGMSLKAGEVLVEPESGVLTPGMGLAEIRRVYSPEYHAKLYYCLRKTRRGCLPVFRRTTDPQELAHLAANWRRAILAHPMAYLAHRYDVGRALLELSGGAKSNYYLDQAPHHRLAKPYPPSPQARTMLSFLDAEMQSVWFRPWIYLALSVLLLPVALARYLRGGPVLPVLLLFSGLSYLLSFFLATGSSSYRYTVWTTLCCVLALASSMLSRTAPMLKVAARRVLSAEGSAGRARTTRR